MENAQLIVERGVCADIATKVEIRLGLRRLVLDLKLIHCLLLWF